MYYLPIIPINRINLVQYSILFRIIDILKILNINIYLSKIVLTLKIFWCGRSELLNTPPP